MSFRTSDFDFELPPDRIAQTPAAGRDQSRLLVVDRSSGSISHRRFEDLVDYIDPRDVVVLNETRVFPARLRGRRAGGGEAEVLLLHPSAAYPGAWEALVRPGSKLKTGRTIVISPELSIEILDVTPDGNRIVRLKTPLQVDEALERFGEVPLPPYIHRPLAADDRERYQTVYAKESGSVAAPTAGLHFTSRLLDALEQKGVGITRLVLHVGVGTFRPVESDDPGEHRMHGEWFSVPDETAKMINRRRAAGGKLWAIGTTTVRTLESVVSDDGTVQSGEGWTDIFIRPPHRFKAVDKMITNFHLPRSTLLMLVAAFAGYELVMESYRQAVASEYRFYSYGDAMAIL